MKTKRPRKPGYQISKRNRVHRDKSKYHRPAEKRKRND